MESHSYRIKFSKDLAKILKYEVDNRRPCLTILIVSSKIQEVFNVQIPSKGFYYYVEKYKKIKNTEDGLNFFIEKKKYYFSLEK